MVTVCKTAPIQPWPRFNSARTDLTDRAVMRLSWSQHLTAARTLERVGDDQAGVALALMGMALLMLLQDLEAGG